MVADLTLVVRQLLFRSQKLHRPRRCKVAAMKVTAIAVAMFAVGLVVLPPKAFAQPVSPSGRQATGPEFQKLLVQPLMVSLELVPLRKVLTQFSEERGIGILIDRRIDPRQLVFVDLQAVFFDAGIAELTSQFASVSVVADTLFVGPKENASALQTRIAITEQALDSLLAKDIGRKFDLARRKGVRWETGATPKEILTRIAQGYKIQIENLDVIPHDQWESGGIVNPNCVEAISMIATQFDLEPKWIDGNTVRLVEQVESPKLQVQHSIRRISPEDAVQKIKERFPDLSVEFGRSFVTVTGLQEEQQEVAVLLGNRAARKVPVNPREAALKDRRYSLKVHNRPFRELMGLLEKQGVQFRWSEKSLDDAGVNLDQHISLELNQATIYQMMADACRPLGLTYEVQGMTIILIPAGMPKPQ
ncbi:hypothetical protein [Planctomicrobium sp. SH527]|uniref:hypothetical protein n=1 Tax=Planctomicrobium sp. SH527 TaxID=3448123 RepID=UPI003F5BDBF9